MLLNEPANLIIGIQSVETHTLEDGSTRLKSVCIIILMYFEGRILFRIKLNFPIKLSNSILPVRLFVCDSDGGHAQGSSQQFPRDYARL
jgi:hypothetical protein